MAKKGKTKTSRGGEAIPPHPRLPKPKEIGELCAEVYRNGIKLARAQGVDEETVEQLALDHVRQFMAACIKESKADWKAYSKSSGVIAAFVKAKKKPKSKSKSKRSG